MLREALDSEADVPVNKSELRGHVDNAKLFEQQKKRTRADSVVGIRALSADPVDRSTRGRADSYRNEISTTHAMSTWWKETLPTLLHLVNPQSAGLFNR